MNRSLKTLIVVSVLLNVLLLSAFFGHAGRCLIGEPEHRRSNLHDLAKALPEEKRQGFEANVAHFEQDTGELRQQLSDARKKAINLLKANPFDKEAYLAQVQVMQQLRTQMMQGMAQQVAQLAEQCTPEERVTLANMLRTPHQRPGDDDKD